MSHGQAAMTDKADMYALGCLLVEMCTEQPWDTGVLNRKVSAPEADTALSPLVHIIFHSFFIVIFVSYSIVCVLILKEGQQLQRSSR